ncbi:MAG: ribose-phosphate pyrophosphokinase-like domain-containing protein [Christensenellales bacterium]
MNWQVDSSSDQKLHSFYGSDKNGFLLEAHCPRFGTGEGKGMIADSVRGYDLFIICDVGAYQCTYKLYGREIPMTPDEHYADLKRIIAAVSGKAYRINVIMPMLYEGRQHRRTARESMDCAVMLQELVNMGVSNIITFDAHDPRVQNAIPLSGFESIMPTYQMLKAMCHTYDDLRIDKHHMMVISPDEGALNRNIYYSSAMGVDMGMFYKRRDYTRVVNGRNPIVATSIWATASRARMFSLRTISSLPATPSSIWRTTSRSARRSVSLRARRSRSSPADWKRSTRRTARASSTTYSLRT